MLLAAAGCWLLQDTVSSNDISCRLQLAQQ
jgi:hypothetical protein